MLLFVSSIKKLLIWLLYLRNTSITRCRNVSIRILLMSLLLCWWLMTTSFYDMNFRCSGFCYYPFSFRNFFWSLSNLMWVSIVRSYYYPFLFLLTLLFSLFFRLRSEMNYFISASISDSSNYSWSFLLTFLRFILLYIFSKVLYFNLVSFSFRILCSKIRRNIFFSVFSWWLILFF